MAGVTVTRGTVLKGHSIRKVENRRGKNILSSAYIFPPLRHVRRYQRCLLILH